MDGNSNITFSSSPEHAVDPCPSHADLLQLDYNYDLDAVYIQPEDTDEPTDGCDSTVKRSRKRKRNREEWQCNVRKERRAAGEAYISKKKNHVAERKMKEKCKDTCKVKCFDNFTDEDRELIFRQFWSKGTDNNAKRQFVASCVTVIPIRRKRERTGKKSRNSTILYHFIKNGNAIRVCKTFFLNTLSISQTFVETAIAKKPSEGDGVVSEDLRGKHSPSNKISEEVRDRIREHIRKFPMEESHYGRRDGCLNIAKMFKLYVEDCQRQNVPPNEISKFWLYSYIFNTEFDYSFKKPADDRPACDSCDGFQIKLRDASSNEEKEKIRQEYDSHWNEASKRYWLKKIDKEKSFEDCSHKVVMVDLEKCLPTPVLKNAKSSDSLKLWTFNYTVHDASDNKTYCCMWDESIAGRGVNEMASCFTTWIETVTLPPTIKKLTIWSDNCLSQNRNSGMIMCYFYLLRKFPQLETVEHKFLLRGHTHLEADSDHSIIEREWSQQTDFKIMTPWDWQQLVRISARKRSLQVIPMEKNNFKNFKSLYEGTNAPFVMRKTSSNGKIFRISKIVCFQAKREGFLLYKYAFENDFIEIDLKRNRQGLLHTPEDLPPMPLKMITSQKYNHLQHLLKWVPKVFHPFYQNLAHGDHSEQDED